MLAIVETIASCRFPSRCASLSAGCTHAAAARRRRVMLAIVETIAA